MITTVLFWVYKTKTKRFLPIYGTMLRLLRLTNQFAQYSYNNSINKNQITQGYYKYRDYIITTYTLDVT